MNVFFCINRLPVNAAKRKLWLENLNIQEPREKKPVVCSMHFDESLFDRTSVSTVRLRDHAVPQVSTYDYIYICL